MTCNLATNEPLILEREGGRSVALSEHLKLLESYLQQHGVTEVVINQPCEILTESNQGWQAHHNTQLDNRYCQRLAKLIATYSGQKLDAQHPILSATLPAGERVQIAIAPVVLFNRVSLTIRKPSIINFSLEDYQQQGYFTNFKTVSANPNHEKTLTEPKSTRTD